MLALSPTTLLAPPLLATRPRLLRPIEPRLAARLDATVAIPQPQSSPDSRPATNAVLSEQLQPAHHRPPHGVMHLCLPKTYKGSHSSHRGECAVTLIFSMRMVGLFDGLNTTTATGMLDACMWSSSVLRTSMAL